MSNVENEDDFDRIFRIFSTEHSWYKGGSSELFEFVPLVDDDHDREWTMHCRWNAPVPAEVRTMITAHQVPMTSLLCCHHGKGRGFNIAFGDSGGRILDELERFDTHRPIIKRIRARHVAVDGDTGQLTLSCRGGDYPKEFYQLFKVEYERMLTDARTQFYLFLNQLYPWIRKQSPTADMKELVVVASTYRTHVDTIISATQTLAILLPELVNLVIDYHHVF